MKKIMFSFCLVAILILSSCGNASEETVSGDVADSIANNTTEQIVGDVTENGDSEQALEDYYVPRTDERAITNTISDEIKVKATAMPEATYESIPEWNGTTIYNKYEYGWTGSDNMPSDFQESTVQEISDIGFDFVRVLIDTRYFYSESPEQYPAGPEYDGNSDNVNLNELENLDNLISWCIERDIHVCIDVHNTPGGYMIGGDEEETRELLFTPGSEEEQMFYDFWDLIAKRYKDVSSNGLSFNIYNEPPRFVGDEQYTEFIKKALDLIFAQTEDRLIFVDMLAYAREPVYGLVGEKIVQSFHLYEPYEFSHNNQDDILEIWDGNITPSVTVYPIPPVSSLLHADDSYTIHGDFPESTEITIQTAMGAIGGTLQVVADGEIICEEEITEDFMSDKGAELVEQDGEKVYNVWEYGDGTMIDISFSLTNDAKDIEFCYVMPGGGDGWFEANALKVETDDFCTLINTIWVDGNQPPADITIDMETGVYTYNLEYDENDGIGKSYIEDLVKKFADFSAETGTTIMLQETGDIVYTDTASTVRYFDDVLSVCEEYGIGWVIYSHDGCEFSYVAIEDRFRRLNGNYEEINPGRYIETNIRDILQKHMN